MLLERGNEVGWTWLVVAEMFLAGLAAGAYVTIAVLELSGRGRSAAARAAHLVPLPVTAIAAMLLIVDLTRPERFWHMALMSEVLLPMLKPWSPMSIGTWLVIGFTGFAVVSFVDALVARGMVRIGRWRSETTLHGSAFGTVWSIVGALFGLGVGTYSGVLLSATNFPGWGQTPLLGAVYVATAMSTGCAAVILVRALAGEADPDLFGLVRTNAWLIAWWLLVVLGFVVALLGSGAASVFVRGLSLLVLVAGVVLAGVLPLVLQFFARPRASGAAVYAVLVLVGGFLLRFGIMLGPQAQFR